jgi:hypothetical protein
VPDVQRKACGQSGHDVDQNNSGEQRRLGKAEGRHCADVTRPDHGGYGPRVRDGRAGWQI